MAINDIHEGDIGTRVQVTLTDRGTVLDISLATTQEFYFLKPDGTTTATVTTVFLTDGTDGILYYDSLAATFDAVGVWKLQAHIITPSGEWKSEVASFFVLDNLV